jgi:hypothetical protein
MKGNFGVQPRLVGMLTSLIGSLKVSLAMKDERIQTYPSVDDRVQWHRAWAETMRWLEEYELKHMEFIRCIKSFETMRALWGTMAKHHAKPGYAAFARRQASTYKDLRDDAISRFKHVGNPNLLARGDTSSFVQAVLGLREKHLSWLTAAANRRS